MGIGKNIKKFRLKNGLTQKQLGEKCGMADSAIRRYELERANPKIETLQKIATALNVSISDLDSRPDFTIAYLRKELDALKIRKLEELNQIPDSEWFGDKWNRINQEYCKKQNEIQTKIDKLSNVQKEEISFDGCGKRIKNIREKKGMPQQTLASLANIPLFLLRKYEEQHRTPSYEHTFQIAKVLKVPAADIDISLFLPMCADPRTEEDMMYDKLINTYNILNKIGQKKILEQIEMISKIPDYLENKD